MTKFILLIVSAGIIGTALAAERFTAPQQPWTSPDGHVRLLRPAIAHPEVTGAPIGSLMASGWRLTWDGAKATPGSVLIRLALPVSPGRPRGGRVTEVLQIGESRNAESVRSCRTYGLAGTSAQRRADRVIGGVRYLVWTNSHAGMSQRIDATDLRTIVAGTCYAVERFSYTVLAADADPAVTLPQASGAAALDAALASLRISSTRMLLVQPPVVRLPPGAIAR